MADDAGDWQRLGREVARARLAAGYRDTASWAEQVGRSTRVLLGLERGERQGRKTLEAVELALAWPAGRAHQILFGTTAAEPVVGPDPDDASFVEDRGPDDRLPRISDDEVVALIERQQRELAELLEKMRGRSTRPLDGPE